MRHYFAIIATMRTGSNLLEKTIEGFGDTICYGEPFNACFIGGPRKTSFPSWDIARRDQDPMGFLSAIIAAEARLIPGFRIFDDHTPRVLDTILRDPNCRRIVLRRDPVDSFVSLQIARQTDQWLLRNPKRRRTARITFDQAEFEAYRSDVEGHYRSVSDGLDAAGQTALWVNYDDLTDQRVLSKIASHIGSSGTPPRQPPLLRQNPEALSEKVINYHEMCTALKQTPERADPVPPALFVPDGLPLAYAPISGPAQAPVLALLQRIQVRTADRPRVSRSAALSAIAQGDVFPQMLGGDRIGDARRPLTMICHPAVRAYGLFAWEVFGPAWQNSRTRTALTEACPDLPTPKEVGHTEWTQSEHARAFDAFLDLLERSAGYGQSGNAAWESQSALIDGYRSIIDLDLILRLEEFSAGSAEICRICDCDPFPPGQLKSIRRIAEIGTLSANEVLNAERNQRIADIWPEDYRAFGYPTAPGFDT